MAADWAPSNWARDHLEAPRARPPYVGILTSYASYATPCSHGGRRFAALRPGFVAAPPNGPDVAGHRFTSCRKIAFVASLPLDLHDLIGLGAARRDDLDLRA